MRTVPGSTAVGLPGAAAPRLGRVPRVRRAAAAALVAALLGAGAIAVAVSGSPRHEPARAQAAAVTTMHGVSLQSANCSTWWAASEPERMAGIHALTRSIGGSTPYGPGTTLSDSRAHALFDRVCTPTFTSHFMLYEIYTRAAGFKSLGGSG